MRVQLYRRLLAVLAVLAVLAGSAASQPAQAQSGGWLRLGGFSPLVELTDVFLLGDNVAWASGRLGQQGLVARLAYNGHGWQISEQTSFDAPINAVVAIADSDVWAVGENGRILHRDAAGWSTSASGLPNASLQTIQMFGSTSGWAGGWLNTAEGGRTALMLRYADGRWTRDSQIDGDGTIESLHFAPDGGWAVGGSQIWRYSGGNWSKQAAPDPCGQGDCFEDLHAVRALSGDEAWAAGSGGGACIVCATSAYLIHRSGDWSSELRSNPPPGQTTGSTQKIELRGLFFSDAQNGLAVGRWLPWSRPPVPYILRYRAGVWSADPLPLLIAELNAVSMAGPDRALAVGSSGLLLSYGYQIDQPLTPAPGQYPTGPVPNPHDPNAVYFPETGHTLRGVFYEYWVRYGGLAQFGYPLTEEFVMLGSDSQPYTMQFFERNIFEHHPENAPPYHVLFSLLGNDAAAGRAGEAPFQPVAGQTIPGARFFPETSHQIAPQFLRYWEERGGLPLYGYPISEPFTEVNPADGQTYLVQYFERNRFEYHPENAPPYDVLLGLLGSERLKSYGWL